MPITDTIISALIMSMLANGLVLIGVGSAEQTIGKGVMLAIALLISLERPRFA